MAFFLLQGFQESLGILENLSYKTVWRQQNL
jgi:hypothetical protein